MDFRDIPIIGGIGGAISDDFDRTNRLKDEEIRSKKIINDTAERNAKRSQGLEIVNQMKIHAQTGDADNFGRSLKKLSTVMPDGEQFSRIDTDPITGVKRAVIAGPDGEIPIDLTADGMFQTVKGLSAKFADAEEFNKSWEEGQAQLRKFNQVSEFTPMDKNKDYRVMFNERTGDKYYEVRDNATGDVKISKAIPRTLKQAQGMRADELALEEAGLKNKDIAASTKLKGAQTRYYDASADDKGTTGGKASFQRYISDGSDGFNKGDTVEVNMETDERKVVNRPKDELDNLYASVWKNHGIRPNQTTDTGEPIPVSGMKASTVRKELRSRGFDAEWYSVGDDQWTLKRIVKGHLPAGGSKSYKKGDLYNGKRVVRTGTDTSTGVKVLLLDDGSEVSL